jgi:hypothetical protein
LCVHSQAKDQHRHLFHLVQEYLATVTDEDDPTITRNVLAHTQYYTEMLKEKKMKTTQTSLLSFFTKMESVKPPEPQPST